MINKNILKIRKKLDKLDNLLLGIIKKRTILVNQVLKNKRFKKDVNCLISSVIQNSELNLHIACFSRCIDRFIVDVLRFYAEKYKSNQRLKSAILVNVS